MPSCFLSSESLESPKRKARDFPGGKAATRTSSDAVDFCERAKFVPMRHSNDGFHGFHGGFDGENMGKHHQNSILEDVKKMGI